MCKKTPKKFDSFFLAAIPKLPGTLVPIYVVNIQR
jgi:hypothetical protein